LRIIAHILRTDRNWRCDAPLKADPKAVYKVCWQNDMPGELVW